MKFKKNPQYLSLMHDTFKKQVTDGIIQKIGNIDQFVKENPCHSFLPHMGVFKPDRETTKCRVVFLSNLCEKSKFQPSAVSHNQPMYYGQSLNQKISTALIQLRFGKFSLCYDLKKTFNQIQLSDSDSEKLLFLGATFLL